MCKRPGNSTFVIRSPTLGMTEWKNQILVAFRDEMMTMIFKGTSTVCCGNHRIVFLDSQLMLDPKSHVGIDRPLPPRGDPSKFHWPSMIRLNLLQSIWNLLRWVPEANTQEDCCIPAPRVATLPNISLKGLVALRPSACTMTGENVVRADPGKFQIIQKAASCAIIQDGDLLQHQGSLQWTGLQDSDILPSATFVFRYRKQYQQQQSMRILILAAPIPNSPDSMFSWYVNGAWVHRKLNEGSDFVDVWVDAAAASVEGLESSDGDDNSVIVTLQPRHTGSRVIEVTLEYSLQASL
eukprot:c6967_g1_i1.p1 GENE.c6967_g1_i1~~c6967_g1_i1.p1  ORF type:complete len:295 (+),score=46.21 c6967_g1_i1:891-1775(+)